jgi:hypothetical protein
MKITGNILISFARVVGIGVLGASFVTALWSLYLMEGPAELRNTICVVMTIPAWYGLAQYYAFTHGLKKLALSNLPPVLVITSLTAISSVMSPEGLNPLSVLVVSAVLSGYAAIVAMIFTDLKAKIFEEN